ncbi:hypothetical protein FZC84_12155 [Rossellomorea vietnamensis]|uniref:Uncharacterized protein n=1 Tax=Rossellomorea vietnamensis TaxID=218284 RepID=A0A5D4MDQ3_9BACI|nr:hypothetical protein [Rossellomorea vietnamensis]TYR99120.1 hypothetical protein FZC84_12155 [Rossellomorea vietnamensis]
MDIVWGIGLIVILVSGAVSVRKEYLKSSEEEKAQVKGELRKPLVLLPIILITVGLLLLYVSLAFPSAWLLAYALLGMGMVIVGAELSKQNSKGMILVVIGASTVLMTGFLAAKSFW